jgi:hypothetical protein
MFNKHKAQRLIGLSIMFFLLLNFPLIKVLESRQLFLGLPTLYVGIFALWLVLIVWTIRIIERKQP